MAYTYMVPAETNAVLQQHAKSCENMGLILGRYIPREVIANSDIPDQKNKKHRDPWLQERASQFANPEKSKWSEILKASAERWNAMTAGALQFGLRLNSRLIVGLGGKGVLETGLTLHPVTGLPHIPGSALKGLARNYVLLQIAEMRGMSFDPAKPDQMNKALNELEEHLVSGKDLSGEAVYFATAFGSQEQAGACVFYDAVVQAVPDKGSLFSVEVMTPHFGEYYSSSGHQPPSDDGNPVPLSFLTVSQGVTFGFAVGKRTNATISEEDMMQTAGFLFKALQTLGIGSKTASGYGAFIEPKPKKK